jgi:hypothetical protein
MTKSGEWLVAASVLALTLALSVTARAQNAENAALTGNPDSAHCLALAKQYNRYLKETIGQGEAPTSLDGRVASEQCSGGNAKASILVLERKLVNAKINLPQH